MAQARAPPGTVGATAFLPERRRQIKAACEPRRSKPEDGSGGDRDDDGKRQHAPADGYVIEARQAFGNKLQQEFPGAKENRETGDAARGNKSTAKCRRGACSLRSVCKAKQAARLEDVNALSYTQVEVK